jgi:hypothetical protein
MIQWCLKEATAKGLRECDFWGGLALDEMKIQVHVALCIIFRVRRFLVDSVSTIIVFNFRCEWPLHELRVAYYEVQERIQHSHGLLYMFHNFLLYVSLQENLEMTVKNGKHKLVGLVNLGGVHNVMRTLSGNVNIFNFYNIGHGMNLLGTKTQIICIIERGFVCVKCNRCLRSNISYVS